MEILKEYLKEREGIICNSPNHALGVILFRLIDGRVICKIS